MKRTGKETRLLIDGAGGSARRQPDHSLHRILARAYRYNDMVMRSAGKTMGQLAAEAGVGGSYFTRILRLSFLAPEIVKAILRDRHPIELTAKRLANELRLPIAWDEQRALARIRLIYRIGERQDAAPLRPRGAESRFQHKTAWHPGRRRHLIARVVVPPTMP